MERATSPFGTGTTDFRRAPAVPPSVGTLVAPKRRRAPLAGRSAFGWNAGGAKAAPKRLVDPNKAAPAPRTHSCTIGRDVRTDRAALGAARDQLPVARGAFGLHRGIRPGRFTPGIRK